MTFMDIWNVLFFTALVLALLYFCKRLLLCKQVKNRGYLDALTVFDGEGFPTFGVKPNHEIFVLNGWVMVTAKLYYMKPRDLRRVETTWGDDPKNNENSPGTIVKLEFEIDDVNQPSIKLEITPQIAESIRSLIEKHVGNSVLK